MFTGHAIKTGPPRSVCARVCFVEVGAGWDKVMTIIIIALSSCSRDALGHERREDRPECSPARGGRVCVGGGGGVGGISLDPRERASGSHDPIISVTLRSYTYGPHHFPVLLRK